eukprot:TRINITY_DN3268_c0_g1_i3.p1 TRINITY_DN3268_c0_g1~~TRINITY_DN3268_c0_g1_i3.p1  ORF type:complete len:851 (+),score=91.07 TRINITY_DN3268_c0_g1_i3:6146-8698(+)
MIERLKTEVLKAFGEDLLYTKDCKFLADKISEETGGRISTTTIRRLYGFLKSSSAPGKYTLATLANFVGFHSWDDFCEHWSSQNIEECGDHVSWDDFHKRSLEFSEETFLLIAGQSGIPFQSVARRHKAEERIKKFLKSDKIATSFIAPGGFGKSTFLAKWFERSWLKESSKDAVLFLNASFMISFLNHDFKLDSWIQEHIRYNQKDALKYFLNKPESCDGKLIFVIDALDEITYDSYKLESLFLQLNQFILKYKGNEKVKLIITSRNSTWDKFASPFITKNSELTSSWYDLNTRLDLMSRVNLKPLTEEEIQYVFNGTINKQYFPHLKVNELTLHQKKTISNPFFLELFVKLFSPNKLYQLDHGQELLIEYLKNKVFYSRFSEEKMDILHAILELIEHGKNGTAAKKMDLREKFPIHLKSGGNYFNAYEELVSYGLLTEFITINEFNSYCKYVKITNEVLFETLIGVDIIQKNEGLNFDLLKQVEREYADFEIKNRLIELLLANLLITEKYSELSRLFELSDDTLSDQNVLDTILNSHLLPQSTRNELIQEFAIDKRAEKYLFNSFTDHMQVTNEAEEVLEILAENGCSKNLRIKSLGLLLRNAVFTLQNDKAAHYYGAISEEVLDTTCSGFSISIKIASSLLYNHFIGGESDEIELLKLFYYREMAYVRYGEYEGKIDGEFETVICSALMYKKAYHKIIQLVDDFEHIYKSQKELANSTNYRFLLSYRMLAQSLLGVSLSENEEKELLKNGSLISVCGNTNLQVIYQSYLMTYYTRLGDRSMVEEAFNKGIELSESSDYKLCSISLLRKMAGVYNEWNELTKEKICLMEANELNKIKISISEFERKFA